MNLSTRQVLTVRREWIDWCKNVGEMKRGKSKMGNTLIIFMGDALIISVDGLEVMQQRGGISSVSHHHAETLKFNAFSSLSSLEIFLF